MQQGTIVITNRNKDHVVLFGGIGVHKALMECLISAIITKGLCPGPDSRYWSSRTCRPAEKVQELSE